MEQLIKLVSEKTGLSDAQAKQAVDIVLGFVKDKLPDGLGSQVDSLLAGGKDAGGLGDIAGKIGGFFGK